MKQNSKFFIMVAALIFASSLLLAGCMGAFTRSGGETKPYTLDALPGVSGLEDGPVSQTDLQAKFSAMSRIDEENKTITLITDEYLSQYWSSGEYRALTTQEVLYIIQDTMNLFYNGGYWKIMLPDSAADSLGILEFSGPVRNQQENWETVYRIIVQRLTLLSSPEAFMDGGSEPYRYYIPGESTVEDRAFFAAYFKGEVDSIVDRDVLADYFRLAEIGVGWEGMIFLYEQENPRQVYPTEETTEVYLPRLETEWGEEGCYVQLNLLTGSFHMSGSSYQSFAIVGTFERAGEDLLLYAYGDTVVYVLHREEDHFVSLSEESGVHLKAGLVFYGDSDAFWDILLNWTPPETEPGSGGTVTTPPEDTVPMEPGVYELPQELREKVYDVLIAPENEWIEAIADCDWSWEWKAESGEGEIVELRLCSCKTLTDFTNQRSRKLTEDEWQWLVEVFSELGPAAG